MKEFQYLKGFSSVKIVRFCSHEPMYVNAFLLVMLTFSPAENWPKLIGQFYVYLVLLYTYW